MGLERWGWVDIYKRHSHSKYIFCKLIQQLGGIMFNRINIVSFIISIFISSLIIFFLIENTSLFDKQPNPYVGFFIVWGSFYFIRGIVANFME